MFVPPSEVRDPGILSGAGASLQAIAVATWLFELHLEQARFNSSEAAIKEYSRCCRLMLKAFEDAELKRRFAELKSTAGI
jgi:hypothetical protein